jgi:hypothetical protein
MLERVHKRKVCQGSISTTTKTKVEAMSLLYFDQTNIHEIRKMRHVRCKKVKVFSMFLNKSNLADDRVVDLFEVFKTNKLEKDSTVPLCLQ